LNFIGYQPMSIEQNTGKPARLSLSERAKQGLLLLEPELALGDLLQLEHHGDPAARMALSRAIKAAIDYGDLATRTVCQPWQRTVLKSVGGWLDGNPNWDEKRLVNETGATKTVLIDREAYRQWRAQCPANLLSELTQITKWLGATPALAATLPVETSLPEPARPASAKGGAAEKEAALLALLDEVDKRAAEQGAGFNRDSLPGTKAEFHRLAIAFNYRAFSKALSTFSGYLKGHCRFQPGVNPKDGKGAAVWALFPEYRLKLG
jgi:hypothetical protein